MTTYLGIDVSKATLDTLLLREGQRAEAAQFANTRQGFNRLPEVDLDAVKPHSGPTVSPHSHSPYHGDGAHHPPATNGNTWHPGEEGNRDLHVHADD